MLQPERHPPSDGLQVTLDRDDGDLWAILHEHDAPWDSDAYIRVRELTEARP